MELRECLLLKTVTATLNEQSWTYCFDASRKGDIKQCIFSSQIQLHCAGGLWLELQTCLLSRDEPQDTSQGTKK